MLRTRTEMLALSTTNRTVPSVWVKYEDDSTRNSLMPGSATGRRDGVSHDVVLAPHVVGCGENGQGMSEGVRVVDGDEVPAGNREVVHDIGVSRRGRTRFGIE